MNTKMNTNQDTHTDIHTDTEKCDANQSHIEDVTCNSEICNINEHVANICKCGFTCDHELVAPVYTYSFLGWIGLLMPGISARPIKIEHTCTQCQQVLYVVTDEKILKQHEGK